MIAVTGASGHLGRLIVSELLDRNVPAGEIVAIVRTPAKASDLASRGVEVRNADYDDGDSLVAAFEGIDRLLLVSASDVGKRVEQHRQVVNAARQTGVEHLVYTSILAADSADTILSREHSATERLILRSGIAHTFLRNGWYLENYTGTLGQALENGAILGTAGAGRVSAAARADYAAAAATVITEEGHEGRTYELGGDEAFTMTELAEEVSRQSGQPVEYRDLPAEEYRNALLGFGLPEPVAEMLADADEGLERGVLYTDSEDLRRLIGRPTTTLTQAVAAALGD
ncbi:MAG TPA: SDR family oxidoreductase [Trueperaceae bacterium]